MNINNHNSVIFGRVKLNEGGIQTLQKEGISDLNSEINNLKEEFKSYNWDLEIGENGYSLTSPTTKKTHNAPFSIKRQYSKCPENSEHSIIVRMGDKNKVKYKINFKLKNEIKEIYIAYKKASPLEKMKILLKILEKSYNSRK